MCEWYDLCKLCAKENGDMVSNDCLIFNMFKGTAFKRRHCRDRAAILLDAMIKIHNSNS